MKHDSYQIHKPTGEVFTISHVVLQEILRVAIEQREIEWSMSCYEDATRMRSFIE